MTNIASWPGVFREHPVRPAPIEDPLVALNGLPATAPPPTRPHIGFACQWENPPERTWSGSASNLRAALQVISNVSDIGVKLSPAASFLLRGIHLRYRGGRLTSTWSHSHLTDAYNTRSLHHGLTSDEEARNCDAVVMIDDMAALPVPFFVYYDSSWDSRLSAFGGAREYSALSSLPLSTIQRRRDRQLEVYERAAGVVTMSRWLARSLVEESRLSPHKVHVVHPGISSGWGLASRAEDPESKGPAPVPERRVPRLRLLFVGRQYHLGDFFRKGGDLAVAALSILRRDYDPQITLTIAGVPKWPLPGPVPEGVQLLGVLPRDRIAALYNSHDLLVMPARLEPFGIVFTEALAHGLPCVARDAYAMPEIVTPGVSGALVTSDDVHKLAATIAAVLADDSLYETCRDRAPAIAKYFSWERAASQIIQIIAATLSQEGTSIALGTTTSLLR